MPARKTASQRPSVLIVGSEALPFSKTGGLADVLGALPQSLTHLGWEATVVLPRYRGVTSGKLVDRFAIRIDGYSADVGFFEAVLDRGGRALLIDEPALFQREELYAVGNVDYPDNPLRFALLARAALEWSIRHGEAPSVVHAHDWQAGLVPVYLRTLYRSHPALGGTPTVFTIHNLAYQGLFDPSWLPRLDLSWELLSIERMEFWGRISFLKGGINDADLITTVSPTYAREIQTPEMGSGFDGILRRRAADLVGILNGIDTDRWDPAHDPYVPQPFGPDKLEGKSAAKKAVLARYNLAADKSALARPLVGMISRMVDQKGLDLIAALVDVLPQLDLAFVVLGTGETRYQDMWRQLARRYPDRIGAVIGFDEGLAHLIEAGADMFLMPSRFEPCGLNQMYSLRYGTVPIVRRVGGLSDTVAEAPPTRPLGAPRTAAPSTGFVFDDYTPGALLDVLRRALKVFKNKQKWRGIQVAGMRQEHSWDRSAREYVKIYERAMARSPRLRDPDWTTTNIEG
jgi:starch synthase